jgi:hypothetical protein
LGIDERKTPGHSDSAAPKVAPNVAIVVLKRLRLCALGCKGSIIETCNIDQLASIGLHSRALTVPRCARSRAYLLKDAIIIGIAIFNMETGFPKCGAASPSDSSASHQSSL